MKFIDPAMVPFLRQQFYIQFTGKILNLNPEKYTGTHSMVIIQRPQSVPKRFVEARCQDYEQIDYYAPEFYVISYLRPKISITR